jgi:hypothetical protein
MAVEIRRVKSGDEAIFERVAIDVFDEPINSREAAERSGARPTRDPLVRTSSNNARSSSWRTSPVSHALPPPLAIGRDVQAWISGSSRRPSACSALV